MDTKKIIYVGLFFLLFVFSCKKDTEVNKDTFKIENEKVEASTQSVKITGTYAYLGAIDGITLELGRQADLMDGDAYRTLLEGTDFSVEVKNLRTNTTYYYRYSVDYGGKAPYRTEIKTFKTEEYNLPEVKSKEVVSVGVNRAEVSGEVLSDGGGDAVTLRGICWSMSHNPSVGDEYANAGEGIGTFTCELTNLQPEKTYYARAFAGNSKGVSYGEELTLVTLAAGSLAEVKTIGITGNANLQATVSGEVTKEGTSSVIERGVCYGKEHYPTTSGLHVSAGLGTGEFSCQLTNLEAGATYYVRAYAINGQGISYGDEMSFEAQTEVTVPVVFTGMVSDITVSSATGHGTVVSDGGATVTRRGLCWSMEHEPTTGDIYADCGNGVGEFSGLMPHLENMTTYYVRAYAENVVGMAYGEEVSFTVGQHEHVDLPFVETMQIMDVTSTTAWGTGEVLNDGGGTITDRGLCWSTSQEPTIGDSHASGGTGLGFFEVQMTDLVPSTTYYVRAYARNSAGVAYGNEMDFTTMQEAGLPTVMTLDVIDITATTAICGGEVMDDGGDEVYEKGVCWSMSQGPTIGDIHASGGTGIGFFEVQMTDLEPSTTYYVRAYARNNVGVAYGDEMEFTTMSEAGLPTVMTVEVFNITATSAICAGEVMDDGGDEVFEKGVCWSTSHNPTLNDNHVIGGEGGGFFEVELNDLTPGTTYYVRAYAINSFGTGYGEEVSFTTMDNGAWLYYDYGICTDAIGLTDGGSFYWGVMFPAGSYQGNMVTKVSMYDYAAHTGNILVYQGGTNAPGTLVGQQAYTCTGSEDFVEWEFTAPVVIDPTQILWIVMNNDNGQYVASACANTGDANGRWISTDGVEWGDVATYGFDFTWMLRGFVTNGRGETMELKPIATKPHAPLNGKAIQLKSAKQ